MPKGSTASALPEGKSNLFRMRQEIPLTDAELAALDDGVSALESLLNRLAGVPTPAGPTPLQLQDGHPTQAKRRTEALTQKRKRALRHRRKALEAKR
jgi:hypothetical protein